MPSPPPSETTVPPELASTSAARCGLERTTRQRLSWAALLARIFFVDVLWCPRCGGRRRIVSFLTDPAVVRRILTHLGLPTEAPAIARAALAPDVGVDVAVDVEDPALLVDRHDDDRGRRGGERRRAPP